MQHRHISQANQLPEKLIVCCTTGGILGSNGYPFFDGKTIGGRWGSGIGCVVVVAVRVVYR